MLQRAASNAYSWWWASHIRTKQSKWLEENLQEMEEKVSNMLHIIENEGDSFAKRVEMYYKKRPELIGHVEDSYRSYRALAERYDHLSKELQSANRTIAAVFPEQVRYGMEDDDDYAENIPMPSISPDNSNKTKTLVSRGNIPRVPIMPKKDFRCKSMIWPKKDHLMRTASSVKAAPTSGLTREEAVEEIEKIQKEILALQTEREFVQSIYERCNAKCNGIESQITSMQERVMSLRDEFRIGDVIDDNEARNLMAATALKSCHETLVKLQEKREQSAEEVKVESRRVKEMIKKFNNLQGEFHSNKTDLQASSDEQDTELENVDGLDTELLRANIKKKLEADSNSSLTVMQLAERINELVETIARLETAVSSQDALINVLKSETDGLQERIKTLEEEKESLMENSENMSNKLKELEEELCRVKSLNQNVKEQNDSLQTNFTEASCSIDHLSVKLKNAKPHEEVDNAGTNQEKKASLNAEMEIEGQQKEEKKDNDKPENEKKELLDADTNLDNQQEVVESDEGEDEPDFRRIFDSGLEDREKLLVEEYTSVLRNYKEVRRRLGNVEKKNRDGFFELALQIRELKNALAGRDEEIRSLRKVTSLKKNEDENNDTNSTKSKYSASDGSPESVSVAVSIPDTNHSTLSSPQMSVSDSVNENHIEPGGTMNELSRGIKRSITKDTRNEIKTKGDDTNRVVSAIEEKFRSDIDGLLEENLEFWLRFSSSFNQIKKFQTSVQDLKEELANLNNSKKQEASVGKRQEGSVKNQCPISDARPIYRHLKEILTELTLWLETNSVLKDELRGRYASLCSIQEEISRISAETSKEEEAELSEYQAAKFQGEIMNMKQENNKVGDELRAGVDRVSYLRDEVEKMLLNLDEEFGLSTPRQRSKSRIPLRSFLFGVKLKKQRHRPTPSLFACGSPSFLDFESDMPPAED
ncbi:hypothetical protein JCGZ_15892 [Jatropha curcas]|uniref:NAB domain-containing protein n=1 Tax=Jatropha curcas TaxID=180498 RepID=A0A067LAE9_JATCU|nr:hypothetical protein JCGZ_15892 [Jatropha curcas]